jgi:hypothetical protein
MEAWIQLLKGLLDDALVERVAKLRSLAHAKRAGGYWPPALSFYAVAL